MAANGQLSKRWEDLWQQPGFGCTHHSMQIAASHLQRGEGAARDGASGNSSRSYLPDVAEKLCMDMAFISR